MGDYGDWGRRDGGVGHLPQTDNPAIQEMPSLPVQITVLWIVVFKVKIYVPLTSTVTCHLLSVFSFSPLTGSGPVFQV